jgi:hypothetical protein
MIRIRNTGVYKKYLYKLVACCFAGSAHCPDIHFGYPAGDLLQRPDPTAVLFHKDMTQIFIINFHASIAT